MQVASCTLTISYWLAYARASRSGAEYVNGHPSRLTQARLKELLDYDPVTGIFVWKSDRPRVKRGDVAGGPDAWGYVKIGVDGLLFPAHRLAWLWVYGEFPAQRLK